MVEGAAMGTGPNAEVVNDRAKLIMHRLIARGLARDPGLVEAARDVLARHRADGRDYDFIGEWERLLDRGPDRLRRILVARDERMTFLRSCSPFTTARGVNFRDPALRLRIWRKARMGFPGARVPGKTSGALAGRDGEKQR